MNNKKGDRVNFKLQKTISNLISNVISSLCQQVVTYESSIGIFGLLSINIDNDVDITVKLDETFVKKDSSKSNETTQKPDTNNIVNITNNDNSNNNELEQIEMEIETKESDCPLLIDESEKSSLSLGNGANKRRPRKPQLTFRHIAEDECHNGKEVIDKPKQNSPDIDLELKIDTQFDYQTATKSFETDNDDDGAESGDEIHTKTGEKSLDIISHSSSTIDNAHNRKPDIDNSFSVNKPPPLPLPPPPPPPSTSSNSTNTQSSYKCSICDRQFKRKFCLTRHKRVHQNYKTYLCNVCGLGFDLINQLKRHLRNTHACSRENLRRSCRNNGPNNANNKSSDDLIKSSPDRFCPTIECSWQLAKPGSQLPILPTTKQSDNCLPTKSLCFNQFSFPPNLIIANSGKKPSPSAFSQTFSSTPTSGSSTQYQVRQMFNSIMSATEASLPYNNAAMYYMQNYTNILPNSSNAIYHHSGSNGTGHKSMPNLSSAPTPTTNTMTLTNSFSQRLPIYRFPAGLFTSPSLKSIPLPLGSSWTGVSRASDSNQCDNNNTNSSSSKIKQSASPTVSAASVNQIPKVSSD